MAEGRVHPDCRNASNPYHKCVDFCFQKIAELKESMEQPESDVKQGRTTDGPASSDHHVQESGQDEHHDDDDDDDDDDYPLEENVEVEDTQLTEWKKKLFQLSLKMAELNRSEASTESRSISKEKWIDERKKTIGKLLDANGLDMKKADMLDTLEAAENKYKKCEKQPAPSGWDEGSRVHPDCRNASNPYHKCVDFCFLKIAESKESIEQPESDVKQGRTTDGPASSDHHVQESGREEHDNGDENTQLTEWKKKLFQLNLKLDETRKAYETAIVADLNRSEASTESRSISKEKWIDERKKTIGKLLDANGLDMKKADMLDTLEAAENKYKKCEKQPAPSGWDVSSQKTLYDADKKLTKNIECNVGEYDKMKEADPEFHGDASSSLQYGKAPKISEDKICKMVKELHDKDEKEDMIYKMVKELLDKDEKEDMIYKMVKELLDKDEKRKAFSWRRKFHEEKDIDSINDHNENFHNIIERAYGKYTQEIKNNLERGTALQGCVGAGLFTFCIGVAVLNGIWVSNR